MLMVSQNWGPRGNRRHSYASSAWIKTAIVIVDTVILLTLLPVNETQISLESSLKTSILVLCCINFMSPTISLYMLGVPDSEFEQKLSSINIAEKSLYLIFVDIAYLAVRSYIWFVHGYGGYLPLLKNLFSIIYVGSDIYSDFVTR
jgi:hypothetical protein